MIARAPSLLVALLALFALFAAVDADTPIDLGDAYSYAVLAGREIRYASGRPTINGNIGLYPGTSITGIIVPIHNGVVDIDNPASIAALSALSAAYSAAEGKEATSDLSGQDLGGMTLVGGVYTFSDSAALDGVLTLDAQEVVFKDGVGNANHVTWWVGNAATVNYGATVVGNVLVGISIIAFGDVTVYGRLLAKTALTLQGNYITINIPPDNLLPNTPIHLGEASSYALLARSTISFDGSFDGSFAPIVNGDIGVYPGTSLTGWVELNGVLARPWNVHTPSLIAASYDVRSVHSAIIAQLVADTVLTGDLAGMVLVPGVYRHPDSAELNGVLTLDAQSNAAAVWTLQIGKHMLFAPGSRVVFKDGVGSANHVTWWIGTAVTIGENAVNQLTVVLGTVLAGTSFTINHGARVTGRLLAQAACTLPSMRNSTTTTIINLPDDNTDPPSSQPTSQPTQPTSQPTQPSSQPSALPSAQPTTQPSVEPSAQPSALPSALPSSQPS
eukprot:CAMPEP_0173235906 /NCGR_PEP_ID=MMETSP1142-20121109/11126_1 /TAXON_ID=483371 /ORGANISM="non described non described, Strain CCMP2298" /LENGTH=500 /DNA_ID=CAMNT_0014166279 /DNA_START=104 /DNA_END=1602 /DNA_ORIENTATION=+